MLDSTIVIDFEIYCPNDYVLRELLYFSTYNNTLKIRLKIMKKRAKDEKGSPPQLPNSRDVL